MRALRFPEAYKAEVVNVRRPEIRGARELILKVESCGICASDVAAYKGMHPYRRPPIISGHECAGTVVETGTDVRDIQIGDRVAVEPHVGCGECEYCRSGEYQQCTNKGLVGVGDWIGGFAEYILVKEPMCYKLPAGVSFEVGALLEPYNVGLHAVRRAGIRPGDRVGIVGTGTIGLATLLALPQDVSGNVFVTDISAAKIDLALDLGADYAYNPALEEVSESIKGVTPSGLDVVFVTVPKEEAIDMALSICKRQGRVILIATLEGGVQIETHKIQQAERSLIGTAMYNRSDWLRSLEHLEERLISRLQRLISVRISIDQAASSMDDLAYGRSPDTIKTMITNMDNHPETG